MDHAVRRPSLYRPEGSGVNSRFLGTDAIPAAGIVGLDARLAAAGWYRSADLQACFAQDQSPGIIPIFLPATGHGPGQHGSDRKAGGACMMASSNDPHQKVRTDHLQRDAYLYIRQSTLQQVFHNTESTQRQYALKQRAIALGWPIERVNIIDGDQGQSGASAADREGFQKLVAEVGMGRAGIVLGLEVSRLARNNCDWHRLLEICGLTDTLILDEDGLYDPGNFNDRLLLGLKGAMSEAEGLVKK